MNCRCDCNYCMIRRADIMRIKEDMPHLKTGDICAIHSTGEPSRYYTLMPEGSWCRTFLRGSPEGNGHGLLLRNAQRREEEAEREDART